MMNFNKKQKVQGHISHLSKIFQPYFKIFQTLIHQFNTHTHNIPAVSDENNIQPLNNHSIIHPSNRGHDPLFEWTWIYFHPWLLHTQVGPEVQEKKINKSKKLTMIFINYQVPIYWTYFSTISIDFMNYFCNFVSQIQFKLII